MSLTDADIAAAQRIVAHLATNPDAVHDPRLDFLRAWATSLGASLPAPKPATKPELVVEDVDDELPPTATAPATAATPAAAATAATAAPTTPEPEEEIDTGLMFADAVSEAPQGDASKEPSDEDRELASTERALGLEAQKAGNFAEAIEHFTKAVVASPSAPTLSFRAACFLAWKKPNSAVRDADAALALNADSAKAHKVRGMALRALGRYEEAMSSLVAGQKIDFDDSTEEVLRFCKPKAAAARERAQRAKAAAAAAGSAAGAAPRSFAAAAAAGLDEFSAQGGLPEGVMPGSGSGMGASPDFVRRLLSDPEMMALMADPVMLGKLQGLMTGKTDLAALAEDPKLAPLFAKLKKYQE